MVSVLRHSRMILKIMISLCVLWFLLVGVFLLSETTNSLKDNVEQFEGQQTFDSKILAGELNVEDSRDKDTKSKNLLDEIKRMVDKENLGGFQKNDNFQDIYGKEITNGKVDILKEANNEDLSPENQNSNVMKQMFPQTIEKIHPNYIKREKSVSHNKGDSKPTLTGSENIEMRDFDPNIYFNSKAVQESMLQENIKAVKSLLIKDRVTSENVNVIRKGIAWEEENKNRSEYVLVGEDNSFRNIPEIEDILRKQQFEAHEGILKQIETERHRLGLETRVLQSFNTVGRENSKNQIVNNQDIPEHLGFKRSIHGISNDDHSGNKTVNVSESTPEQKDRQNASPAAVGPGEFGLAVEVDVDKLNETEKKKYYELFKRNAFNEYVSNMISLRRTLPDKRDESCLAKDYGNNLPETSVIICFHNEAFSTLLRTVHSVLDRSPPSLIREIILIDDFSNLDHLKDPLEKYISKLEKVRLIRLPQREGLIRARIIGYQNATSQVLTFLDSHVECMVGWLEPLLYRIRESSSNVVFPTLDNIDDTTLEYGEAVIDMVGAFHWKDMTFTWVKVPPDIWNIRGEMAEPLRSPTMPGGIFSIDKDYFTKIGTYDPDLETWGGENLELSFKIWMCGGRVEMMPCSRVAHIFRRASPYTWPKGFSTSWRNVIRVAKVWMDDYQNYFYDFYKVKLDIGDISERQALRKNLKCQTFDWYARNILRHYMYIPTDALTVGEIKSFSVNACLDSLDQHGVLKLFACHGAGGNQNWYYTQAGFVRTEVRVRKESEGCLSFDKNQPTVAKCNTTDPKQIYRYTKTMTLLNQSSMKCITVDTRNGEANIGLYMSTCSGITEQKWILKPRSSSNIR